MSILKKGERIVPDVSLTVLTASLFLSGITDAVIRFDSNFYSTVTLFARFLGLSMSLFSSKAQ